jgi:hypothetical protein
VIGTKSSPKHYDADPERDPSFHFDADPDLTVHFYAHPDPLQSPRHSIQSSSFCLLMEGSGSGSWRPKNLRILQSGSGTLLTIGYENSTFLCRRACSRIFRTMTNSCLSSTSTWTAATETGHFSVVARCTNLS